MKPWLLRVLVGMTFSGWVALVAGWYVTEVGRQPWLVSGVLTSADAAAASRVPAAQIGLTLSLYLLLYAVLITAYVSVLFYLARKAPTTHADAPLEAAQPLEQQLNPVNYPEKEGRPNV